MKKPKKKLIGAFVLIILLSFLFFLLTLLGVVVLQTVKTTDCGIERASNVDQSLQKVQELMTKT